MKCEHNYLPYRIKNILEGSPGYSKYITGTIVELVYCTKCLEIKETEEGKKMSTT